MVPLIKSKSKSAMSENIRREMQSGRPQKQAIAIAYSVARRAAKKAEGGGIEPLDVPSKEPMGMSIPQTITGRMAKAATEHFLNKPKEFNPAAFSNPVGLRREDLSDNPDAPQPNEEAIKHALQLASMAMTGGMPMAAKGSAGIFGGKLASTADHAALKQAEEMAAKGGNKLDIWDKTGWFQGADGKWRFEIPDEKSVFSGGTHKQVRPLGDVLSHPELYAAYPDLKDITTEHWSASNSGHHISRKAPTQPASERIRVPTHDFVFPDSGRRVSLHEAQHAIQDREGFAQGTSPGSLKDFVKREYRKIFALSPEEELVLQGLANKGLKKQPLSKEERDLYSALFERKHGSVDEMVVNKLAYDTYNKYAGEVESRNVEHRASFPPSHRRHRAPWSTEDVPRENQLVLGHKADGGRAEGRWDQLPMSENIEDRRGEDSRRQMDRIVGEERQSNIKSRRKWAIEGQAHNMDARQLTKPGAWRPSYADGGEVEEGAYQRALRVLEGVRNTIAPHKTMTKALGGSAMENARRFALGKSAPWHEKAASRQMTRGSMLHSDVPGRTDKLPISVPSGSFIVPADIVSGLGQNNSLAGTNEITNRIKNGLMRVPKAKKISFKKPANPSSRRRDFAEGGAPNMVNIIAAGGEHIISPDEVRVIGRGDMDAAHNWLDQWVLDERKKHIKTLRSLKPPKRD